MGARMGGDGIFAKFQPRYAEQNVITFPVSPDKKPAIKNWQRVGLDGSAKLAEKFSEVDTFGFPLGPRSGLTILDVDTKDKSVLHEAQSRYGEVPLLVETGGGYHAYYRYSGERRHIRPWGPGIPIDVLGNGYAVGAPSVAAKGPYKIIHGTLDDLKSLPPLHVMLDELRKPIPEGKRNQSLFRMGLEQAAHADDFDTLMDVMRTRNMDCTIPLPESELESRRSLCLEVRDGGSEPRGPGQGGGHVPQHHRPGDGLQPRRLLPADAPETSSLGP